VTLPDFPVTPRRCLRCGNLHQGALAVNGQDPPNPGDLALCLDCGAILVYLENGFRWPTDEETAEALADPDLQRARAAVAESQLERELD
jgi:hypothetical protein